MAMRKVFYGPEGIMLSHILRLYDKQSLLNYAGDLQIRRVSGLKKYELAQKIANELLAPSVMRRRIATFSMEERALLERAIVSPFVPTQEEMEDALLLHEKDCAYINKQDELHVPVDVAEAYKRLNTPDFQQYAKKMSWLGQCLYFGENFYGVFDKDILLKMYNARRGYHISYEELERLCNDFPGDLTECHLEKGLKYIVAEYLACNGAYKKLLDIQAGKEFYIPTSEQVLDYNKNLYLSKEPAYQKLREFFQKEIGLIYKEADDATAEIWEKVRHDVDFQDMLQYLIELYGSDMTEQKIDRLVNLLQNANNHTRLMIHRGHTPYEIMQSEIRNGYFEQPTATVVAEGKNQKKIYPNDPCPCGSGKKYKKCCGRG